jgi:hypothetical protein
MPAAVAPLEHASTKAESEKSNWRIISNPFLRQLSCNFLTGTGRGSQEEVPNISSSIIRSLMKKSAGLIAILNGWQ